MNSATFWVIIIITLAVIAVYKLRKAWRSAKVSRLRNLTDAVFNAQVPTVETMKETIALFDEIQSGEDRHLLPSRRKYIFAVKELIATRYHSARVDVAMAEVSLHDHRTNCKEIESFRNDPSRWRDMENLYQERIAHALFRQGILMDALQYAQTVELPSEKTAPLSAPIRMTG